MITYTILGVPYYNYSIMGPYSRVWGSGALGCVLRGLGGSVLWGLEGL